MTFLVHHTCLQGVLIAGTYFGEASALARYVGIMKTHKGKKKNQLNGAGRTVP
jgi:hypothetical protein